MKFDNVVSIDRPRAEVFAYLTEFENIPRWNHAISEAAANLSVLKELLEKG